MIRTIIQIDEDLCDGCGLCVSACHEGALGLVDGKAKLLRDDYCDGMGDCLPACPAGAISFIEREAAAYDEVAVAANMEARKADPLSSACEGGCAANLEALVEKLSAFLDEPSALQAAPSASTVAPTAPLAAASFAADASASADFAADSALGNWPVQIKLAPPVAPYFAGADLLVAADCTAFARADFHARFMANRVTLIGCPKLDSVDYAEKLAAIIANNGVQSVTVARMQVPCCGGIEAATRRALEASCKGLPLEVVTISTSGAILGV